MFVKPIIKAVILGVTLSLPFMVSASEDLAKKKGCLACHSVDKKIVGPAFKDVAAKYENNPENVKMLIEKVKNGGSGNWGQIPMPPRPGLSDEDAKALVDWVLSQ